MPKEKTLWLENTEFACRLYTMADNLGGMWRGEVTGTNEGEVRLIISDDEGELDGRIEFNDRRYGRAEFMHSGTRNQDGFVISIRPTAAPLGVVVPSGMIRGRMDSTGALVGIWETTIGSEAQE